MPDHEPTSRAASADPAPATTRSEVLGRRIWFQLLATTYALVAAATAAAMWWAGDRYWWGTLLLFAPRWLWSLPLAVLVPWALLRRRPRRALAVWIAGLLVLFPIMGFNVPWRKWISSRSAPAAARAADQGGAAERPEPSAIVAVAGEETRRPWTLKMITCNTGHVEVDSLDLLDVIHETGRELVVLQEVTPEQVPSLVPRDWHCGSELASRYPIRMKANQTDNGILGYWGGFAEIYEVDAPAGKIDVLVVHLQTPRKGIQAFLEGRPDARTTQESLLNTRSAISSRAATLLEKSAFPLVVAGDFNMPIESAIFQRDWSSLRNAFSVAGWGFGHTKFTRLHGVRIDHVLVDAHWRIDRCWVGPDVGSDHRPVLADLTLTAGEP